MASASRRAGLRAATIVVMAAIAIVVWAGDTRAEEEGPYLALGDSVVFGFITQAGFEYGNAANFVGYPDYVAQALHFAEVNASCPGEATAGFISSIGADNGCRPFKAAFPLHVAYASTQLDFAANFLQAHPNTRLVTIGLGANDIFLLQKACAADPQPQLCVSNGLPGVLHTSNPATQVIPPAKAVDAAVWKAVKTSAITAPFACANAVMAWLSATVTPVPTGSV